MKGTALAGERKTTLKSNSGKSSIARTLAIVLVILALQACGGGGSTVSPQPSPSSCSSADYAFATQQAGTLGLHFPVRTRDDIALGMVAVRFEHRSITPEASAALARLSAHQMSELNEQGTATFSIPPSSDPRTVALALGKVRGVAAAGPIMYRHTLTVPNDPDFNNVQQWDMYAISMPSAWGITQGVTGVRIGVIDTGYDLTNPDLAGKVDASIVYDLGTGQQDTATTAQDESGHGSDVSGIAAAGTNNGTDVAGTGWNTHLLEARVFPYGNNCGAATQDIAAGINWAVSNGAQVINLSLGGGAPDNTFEEPAVAAAIAAGVVVVAASGNDDTNTVDYPAADPGVIAVGASAICGDTQNVPGSGHECVASYSNYGTRLSVVAPGGDPSVAQTKCTTQACIDYLQWIENLDSLNGPFTEEVGLFAGTSQATPHVAGAVALMFAKDGALTPAQALSIIKASADNISDPHQGSGRLNVFTALQQTP